MAEHDDQLRLMRDAVRYAGIDLPDDRIALPVDRDIVARPGIRLHYLDWGAPYPDAPTIVFLHGGGINAHTYDLVCVQIRDRYRCLSVDLRGHGDSEWSPEIDYHPSTMALDIEGFVRELGLPRFVLVGMSMGGLTALHFAPSRQEMLRALVIVDVGPEIRPVGADRIRQFMDEGEVIPSLDELVERSHQFNPRRPKEILRRSLIYNLRRLPDGGYMWKYDRRRRRRPNDEGGDSEDQAFTGFAELWEPVRTIGVPTLVIKGADSDVFAEEDATKFVDALPDGELRIVPKAGHSVQGDNPVEFAAVLTDFLARRLT